jgi:Tol biopolymer transport system component/tRNA A-37 threonylcarbamoyl transferase component Bud32
MLSSGTKLGTYEVGSHIGSGGMGEVYQAHDTKLGRDVAIKVLPERFARDPERLARFQREAKLLAALNHPNIAAIYGLEQSGETHYLVMELVPGETLRERVVDERPVPVEEALQIAKQIAEALEAAHNSEKGIIHRDLKPANVKVTPEGRVKVLDFGLAKAFAAEAASEDFSNSPTLSALPTMQGVIMGTAAYMSPEQARGKAVTKASDIWAFGAVLYELLTGKQAFQGEDVADILATVVKTEPDWSRLPADTPPAIRTLLRRCLRKDKRQRLQDAAGVRIEIEDVLSGSVSAEPSAAPTPIGRLARLRQGYGGQAFLGWATAALVATAAIAGGSVWLLTRPAPQEAEAIRFFVSPPEGWNLPERTVGTTAAALNLSAAPVAVSPDGRRVAFVALGSDGRSQLWVRGLDALTAQSLPGTEGAHSPFWSPDSRSLGFSADGKLKKIEAAGGPPITLCDMESNGGTWSPDGVILFNPTAPAADQPLLMKVPAAGGTPTAATVLGEGESQHSQPFFLPDARHFLYTALTSESGMAVYVTSLDSAERKLLLNADSRDIIYSQGHLLFLRETTLMAQPFDADSLELTGEAFPIAEEIQTDISANPYGVFSASESGVLAYRTGFGETGSRLMWYDRAGKQIALLGDVATYGHVELSPDGARAAVNSTDPALGTNDIWLLELERGVRTRFTSDPANDMVPIWSPDGRTISFDSNRSGNGDLYQKAAGGVGAEQPVLQAEGNQRSHSWSSDGRYLLYHQNTATGTIDLWVLPLFGDRKPFPFLETPFIEYRAKFSPDGRWVAYTSNDSGRNEVYVAAFPKPESKWVISTAGGTWSRWRRDGKEIFYIDPSNTLMAAEVDGQGSTFRVGTVRPLFQTRPTGAGYRYDVSADGQRFVVNSLPEQAQASSVPITVVVNWAAGLRR